MSGPVPVTQQELAAIERLLGDLLSEFKKRIEVDPVEAGTVRAIYALYLDGIPGRSVLGVKEVVKVLNERELRTRSGGLFGVGPVHNILTAAYYAGGSYSRGTIDRQTGEPNPANAIIHIPMPPIVSRDIYDAVHAKLASRNPCETAPRVVNGPSLLTGIVVHAACRAGMTRTGTVRRGRHYSYYTCAANHQKSETACTGQHVPTEVLDGLVVTAPRLLAPDRLRSVLEGLMERQATHSAEVSGRIEGLRCEVEDVSGRLKRLYALVEEGNIDVDDALRDRINLLRADKARAEGALERSSTRQARSADIDDEKIQRFGQLLSTRLDDADVNAGRGYIASVVDRIEVDEAVVRVCFEIKDGHFFG